MPAPGSSLCSPTAVVPTPVCTQDAPEGLQTPWYLSPKPRGWDSIGGGGGGGEWPRSGTFRRFAGHSRMQGKNCFVLNWLGVGGRTSPGCTQRGRSRSRNGRSEIPMMHGVTHQPGAPAGALPISESYRSVLINNPSVRRSRQRHSVVLPPATDH